MEQGPQLKCPQVPGESPVGAVQPVAHKIKVKTSGSNNKLYAYRTKSAAEVGPSGRRPSAQEAGGGGLEEQLGMPKLIPFAGTAIIKYPKLGDFTEIHHLTVLEVISPRSGYRQGRAPSEASEKGSSQLLAASGVPRLLAAQLRSLPLSPMAMFPLYYPLLTRTPVTLD